MNHPIPHAGTASVFATDKVIRNTYLLLSMPLLFAATFFLFTKLLQLQAS